MRRICSCWNESAVRRRLWKSTVGRWHRWRGGHASTDHVSVLWSWDFYWTAFCTCIWPYVYWAPTWTKFDLRRTYRRGLKIKRDKLSLKIKRDKISLQIKRDKFNLKIKRDKFNIKIKRDKFSLKIKHDKFCLKIKRDKFSLKIKRDKFSSNIKSDIVKGNNKRF